MSSINAALAAMLTIVPAAKADLDAYHWQARPIIVFADEGDPRLERQLDLFREARRHLLERENVVIVDTEESSALRTRFRPTGFTVVLVGKDGGEKLRETRIVDPQELNALIDTMPMRRREMRGLSPD